MDDVALDAVACITSCSVVFFNALVSGTGILRAVADSVLLLKMPFADDAADEMVLLF